MIHVDVRVTVRTRYCHGSSRPQPSDPLRGRLRWTVAGREIVINELSCFLSPFSLLSMRPILILGPLPFIHGFCRVTLRSYGFASPYVRYPAVRALVLLCTYSLGTVPTFCGNDEKEGKRERGGRRGMREDGEGRTECKGGNKGRVGRDASILQHGRYVGIASRGSLSRTANYGIMHTAGPVPQLWLCYEFVLTQRSPCRRNGCARRRTAATCTTARRRTFISRHLRWKRCKSALCPRVLVRSPSFSCSIRTFMVSRVTLSNVSTSKLKHFSVAQWFS